jgi:hypothetical protein
MHAWASATLHPSYIDDILNGTSAYDSLRPRLFLIKDEKIRQEIGAFYKKLKDAAKKAEGKLGSLADSTEATQEQQGFDGTFQTITGDAKGLVEKLSK